MKLKWYGHASFLITSEKGLKIITDPYEPGGFGGAISYGKIPDTADIVLISHDHGDHNYVQGLSGKPTVVKGVGPHNVKTLQIRGVATFHDDQKGSQRGANTIFCFTVDGVRMCHLGDLGHLLSDDEAKQIGQVDVVLTPVGGFFTIDPAQATQNLGKLNPKIIVPMHFKTDKCAFPIAAVDEFTKGKTGVKTPNSSEIEIKKETLPKNSEIIVLQSAL